jgi:ribonuclease HI
MKRSMASIFCDGACSGNGTRHARAGWAWAYWPGRAVGDAQHSDGGVPAAPATNQRAELTALFEALKWWRGLDGLSVTVYTDSMYSINCMTTWGPGWKRKGWKRAGGEPLQNLDIIVPLVDLWAAEAKARGWQVQHVRGHQSGSSPEAWGNNYVDRLAVVAAGGEAAPPKITFTPAPSSSTTVQPSSTHRPLQMDAVASHVTHRPLQMDAITSHVTHRPLQMDAVASHVTHRPLQMDAITSHVTHRPLQMDAITSHVTHPPPPSGNPFVSPKLQPVRQTSLDKWFR